MSHAVLTLRCRFAEIEGLAAELWERGTLGLREIELPGDRYEIQAYFDAPFAASDMAGFAGWHQEREVSGNEWREAWHPILAGQRLWLAPHWFSGECPAGRLRVNVHPGQGSGTGYSEPTLLMLEVLEREVQPQDTVADIGTGSGILLAAAHALGARSFLGCDVDEAAAAEAVKTFAQENIRAGLWCGSPRSLASGVASLVVANLNAIQLEALAPELTRILAPGGRLLIGGFTERNLPRLQTIFTGPHSMFTLGPWRALLFNPAF